MCAYSQSREEDFEFIKMTSRYFPIDGRYAESYGCGRNENNSKTGDTASIQETA